MNNAEAEDAEKKAYRAIQRHARAIVRDCAAISRIGDGNCGYLLETIKEHLRAAGMLKDGTPYVQKKAKIPAKLRKQVFERDEYRCVQCGSFHDLEADHIHPESLGGDTSSANLQTLCKVCNGKKGNRVSS